MFLSYYDINIYTVQETMKVARLDSNIWLVATCINSYVTPKGLLPKLPMSGMPSSIHENVASLALRTSF